MFQRINRIIYTFTSSKSSKDYALAYRQESWVFTQGMKAGSRSTDQYLKDKMAFLQATHSQSQCTMHAWQAINQAFWFEESLWTIIVIYKERRVFLSSILET